MSTRPRAWPFLVSAAGLLVLLAGTYAFFVRGYMGQILDESAKNGVELGARASRAALDYLHAVPLLCAGIALLAVIIGLARRRVAVTLIALMVVAGANITTQLLKHSLLSRPDTGATDTWHNSFPSGHATVVASVLFALFLVSSPRMRPVAAALGSLITVITGVLLVGTQWHRPSDVVGAILIVAIWGCLGGAVATRVRPVASTARPVSMSAVWVVAALFGVAAAVAFAGVYLSADAESANLTLAAAGGLLTIAAVGASNAAGVTRLFHRVG